MDHKPRSRVREEKGAHDRLIRLALSHSQWALGFEDEKTWWSRFAQPSLHAFSEAGEPMRLVQQSASNDDTDPKALAAYGMLLMRTREVSGEIQEQVWLRFV